MGWRCKGRENRITNLTQLVVVSLRETEKWACLAHDSVGRWHIKDVRGQAKSLYAAVAAGSRYIY